MGHARPGVSPRGPLQPFARFFALIIREETPSPLLVGFLTDGLSELSQEHCLVETLGHGVFLLLTAEGGPALVGSPSRLGEPRQDSMLSPIPEFHAPGDSGPDLTGPEDAQRLCKNDVGEDKGSLGVPTPRDYPPPFRSKDFC